MLARHYRGALSRFLSPDPLILHSQPPPSLSRYSYVRGNPANLVDPYGLYSSSGTVQDRIFDYGRTIGWDDRPLGPMLTRGGNCGPLCSSSGSLGTGQSSEEADGPKDLDFSQARSNPDDPTATGFVERITVWGEGVVVALEDLRSGWDWRSLNVPGPYGSERHAHRATAMWNDPGEGLPGGWDAAYKASYITAGIAASIAATVGGAEVLLAKTRLGAHVLGNDTIGKAGTWFGRRGAGMFNRGNPRAGWGWKGTRAAGFDVFRVAYTTSSGTTIHLDILELYWALW